MTMVKCNKSANSILGDMVNALFNQNARFADKNADGLRKAFNIKQNAKGEIDTSKIGFGTRVHSALMNQDGNYDPLYIATALGAGAIVTAPFR